MQSIFSFSQLVPFTFEQSDHQVKPILEVADFNSDGTVDFEDIATVSIAVSLGIDDAIYDLNADGEVNTADIWETVGDFGQSSSLLDQQLADIHDDIQAFLIPSGIGLAALNGYAPFTQTFAGHGSHWVNPDKVEDVFAKDQADWTYRDYIGLNVSPPEDGFFSQEVLGVFYLLPPPPDQLANFWNDLGNQISALQAEEQDILSWNSAADLEINPLDLFADDPLTNHVENWHTHERVYIRRSLIDPLNSNVVDYLENVTDAELTQMVQAALTSDERILWGIETPNGFDYSDLRYATDIILPKFGMMHVWVDELSSDPLGVFAETNENVAIGYPEVPGSHHHAV